MACATGQPAAELKLHATNLMKGKKYTIEQKVRILMEAGSGEKNLDELCRENNISKLTFQRWRRQFGKLDVHERRRLIETERRKIEIEKRLAECASSTAFHPGFALIRLTWPSDQPVA